MDTINRATGRWRHILSALGVESQYLVNKHGPCPLCGGRDRFRWDNREGSGSYYCNQCGPGPGLLLLRKLHSWDHKTACDEVDKIIGHDVPEAQPERQSEADKQQKRFAKIERVIAEATDPGVVEQELIRRGLSVWSDVLLGHPALAYFDGHGVYRGRYPAIVAPITGPDGRLQSAHRIYVDPTLEARKKMMPPVETVKGGAVRLFEPADVLGLAEGVETALAVRELFGVPTWATLTAGGLEAFGAPPDVRAVIVYGDNDVSMTGQAAAFALAKRLGREGLTVEVSIPKTAGHDWLDVLNARQERGAA